VRDEKVLHRPKEERDILHSIKVRTDNWMLHRNCLLKHVIKGKTGEVDVTGRRGVGRKQLLDDLKERRGYRKLKEEALGRTL
jgi:hypothetical protein